MKPNKYTQARILQALDELIAEAGIGKVSMRLLAHRTGIKQAKLKVYFGNLNGLLVYFLKDGLFQEQSERLPAAPPVYIWPYSWPMQTLELFRSFRYDKTARELLLMELLNDSSICKEIHKKRELHWSSLSAGFKLQGTMDREAVELILLGGMSYLTILAHVNRPILGINLRSGEGWLRVEQALRLLYKALKQDHADWVSQ